MPLLFEVFAKHPVTFHTDVFSRQAPLLRPCWSSGGLLSQWAQTKLVAYPQFTSMNAKTFSIHCRKCFDGSFKPKNKMHADSRVNARWACSWTVSRDSKTKTFDICSRRVFVPVLELRMGCRRGTTCASTAST